MKKNAIKILVVVSLLLSLTTTVFAAYPVRNTGYGCGGGGMGVCYTLMRDANGNIVDKDTFTTNLEQAIKDSYINADNKDFYIDMYDYCAENGFNFGGGRGRGCGRIF